MELVKPAVWLPAWRPTSYLAGPPYFTSRSVFNINKELADFHTREFPMLNIKIRGPGCANCKKLETAGACAWSDAIRTK